MRKNIFIIIILLCYNYGNSQIARPYAGFATYLHSDFSSSVFLGLKTGCEFKLLKNLRPEIEISGIMGALEDFERKNENNLIYERISNSATAVNFSICPKIILGNVNELDSYLVILPKYSISNIEAHGKKETFNNAGKVLTSDTKIAKVWDQSFGIGIGYNFNLSDENPDSLCIILDLQGTELGKALDKVRESDNRITTKWTFGLGFNYYFNLKKKKS
jgi:hypothetical protein